VPYTTNWNKPDN